MLGVDESAGVLLRWCRAAVLAGIAMAAGTVAHVQADGLLPGKSVLVVMLICLTTGTAMFLGRPASRLRVVMLLVAGQTFVHGALTALTGHRGDPPLTHADPLPVAPVASSLPASAGGGGSGRRVGSLMDQLQARPPTERPVQLSVPDPIQHLIADLTGAHALMALAHVGAAVVVGLWLAKGERALWTLLALGAVRAGVAIGPRLGALRTALAMTQRIAHASGSLMRLPVDLAPRVMSDARAVVRSRPRRGPPPLLVA